MKNITTILIFSIAILLSACEKDNISSTLSDVLYVKHKDAEMPAYIYGNGSDKIFLIILNGGPGGKGLEYRVGGIKDLEDKYAIVYLDQRGSGMSSGNYPGSVVSPELMAEDVLALVKVLKYKYGNDLKFFLLGHSWGGLLGSKVLLLDQEPFKGWIEVDGGHNLKNLFDDLLVRFPEVANEQIANGNSVDFWTDVKLQIDEIKKEGYTDDNGTKLNELGYKTEEHLLNDSVLGDQSGMSINLISYLYEESILLTSISFMTINTTLSYIWTEIDYTQELNKITIPSMIMWGKYDLVIPYNQGEEAYNNIGSSEKTWVLFDKSGHSPMKDENEKFKREMINFIEANK
jgi:pimeloyl-ACP methyl ester carboxylesterase